MKKWNWSLKNNSNRASNCLFLVLLGCLIAFLFPIFAAFAEDVSVNVTVSREPVLGSRAQYKIVEVASGGWINDTSLIIKLNMSDLDIGSDSLTPYVEIQPLGTPFTNTATHFGAAVPWAGVGSVVGTVSISGLTEGSYHWQAKAGDAIGNSSGWGDERILTVDTTAPIAPSNVVFTPVGGTVVANTLNSTNTNFIVDATIVAGQAPGGTAELLKDGISFSTPIKDTNIAAGDTNVNFDAGFTANSEVQTAFANDATLSVKLTDAAGNFSISSVNNPAIVVDYPTYALDYQVKSGFVFDEDTKTLTIRVWLEQSGALVVTNNANKLGLATIDIFDEATGVWFNKININTPGTGDFDGIYKITVQNVLTAGGVLGAMPLVAGKSYYARCRIYYGGVDGTRSVYELGTTFAITVSQSLKSVTDAISTVTTGIAQQTNEIKGVVKDEIKNQVEAVMVPKITDIKIETAKILTATESTIPDKLTKFNTEAAAAIKADIKPYVQSGILTRNTTIKKDDTIDISYRTATGLSPTVTVYDPKEQIRLSAKAMVEMGTTGVYTYKLKFLGAWGTGDFTVVCTEPVNGTVDALVITVAQFNLEDISARVSGMVGTSTSNIQGLKGITDTLNVQFGSMDKILAQISRNTVDKVNEISGAVNDLNSAFKQLEELSKQIKSMGGTKGINMEKLYEVSKDKNNDITYIKNKSEELKAAMELNQKMITNATQKPVVQSWFEFR